MRCTSSSAANCTAVGRARLASQGTRVARRSLPSWCSTTAVARPSVPTSNVNCAVDDLVEEIPRPRGEHSDRRLAGQLDEEASGVGGHGEEHGRRQLVAAHVAAEDRRVDRDRHTLLGRRDQRRVLGEQRRLRVQDVRGDVVDAGQRRQVPAGGGLERGAVACGQPRPQVRRQRDAGRQQEGGPSG